MANKFKWLIIFKWRYDLSENGKRWERNWFKNIEIKEIKIITREKKNIKKY